MHPALLILRFLGLTGTPGPDLSAETEQVRCSETAFSQSVENRDWEAFESFIHPEARFPSSGSSPAKVGPARIREVWEGSYESGERTLRWRSRSIEILRPGDLALSRGPYSLRVRLEDGSWEQTWGTFNSIWVREGDRWQVIFDQGSEGIQDGDHELIASGGAACLEGP